MIDYIIVEVKEKNDLDNILSDLNEYIVRKTDSSEYVLNHNLGNFSTYIGVQKGYTKILSDYWRNDKIYVEIVASNTNEIATETEEKLTKKGLNKYGFIIIKSTQLLEESSKYGRIQLN